MIHLCQAELEMIVLAINVLNDPIASKKLRLDRAPFSTKARHAIKGYMLQLIKEIKNVRRATKTIQVHNTPSV